MKALIMIISKNLIGQINNIELAFRKSEQVQNQINHAKEVQFMNIEIRMYRG